MIYASGLRSALDLPFILAGRSLFKQSSYRIRTVARLTPNVILLMHPRIFRHLGLTAETSPHARGFQKTFTYLAGKSPSHLSPPLSRPTINFYLITCPNHHSHLVAHPTYRRWIPLQPRTPTLLRPPPHALIHRHRPLDVRLALSQPRKRPSFRLLLHAHLHRQNAQFPARTHRTRTRTAIFSLSYLHGAALAASSTTGSHCKVQGQVRRWA